MAVYQWPLRRAGCIFAQWHNKAEGNKSQTFFFLSSLKFDIFIYLSRVLYFHTHVAHGIDLQNFFSWLHWKEKCISAPKKLVYFQKPNSFFCLGELIEKESHPPDVGVKPFTEKYSDVHKKVSISAKSTRIGSVGQPLAAYRADY